MAACIAAALLLIGCARTSERSTTAVKDQGRREATQSSPVSPAPADGDSRPVLVCFGDSLTAGVVEHTYPQYLQSLLDQNGYAYRVENQGVSGDTTSDGLARIDNVIASQPALVVLEFGGNDGLRGVPLETTESNLREMITRLQGAKIPLVLAGITLPPNYGPDYVKPFTALFPALAKDYHLRLIPFLLANVYQHSDWMQPDGIHPNGEGNKVVARDVFALVKPVLKKDGASSAHG